MQRLRCHSAVTTGCCLWSCGLRSITCSDYSALLEAVRARMAETGITYATLDHIAGTSAGYAQKILGPRPVKTFGPVSMSLILGALALKVTLSVDKEAEERMRPRWVPRETGPVHLVCHAGRGRAAPGEATDSISTLAAI
jgi:hypothetical protein